MPTSTLARPKLNAKIRAGPSQTSPTFKAVTSTRMVRRRRLLTISDASQPSNDRQNPAQLFASSDRLMPWPRALAADVEQVGAVTHQPQSMTDRGLRIHQAVTAEGVGRDVDYPHHVNAPAPLEAAATDLSFHRGDYPALG